MTSKEYRITREITFEKTKMGAKKKVQCRGCKSDKRKLEKRRWGVKAGRKRIVEKFLRLKMVGMKIYVQKRRGFIHERASQSSGQTYL